MRSLVPRPSWSGAALALAALAPALPLLLIARYSVDVPYWDQWVTAGLFLRLADGSLSLAHLFQQHNEFRQFFPHLLILALGAATAWRVRYEMVVSVLLASVVTWNLHRLGQVAVPEREQSRWLLLAAALLVFSPAQYANWLFGIQIVYFVPIACLTGALAVLSSKLRPAGKLGIAAALATVSTLSSANGWLCWVVLLPALAVAEAWTRPALVRILAGWTALALLTLAVYLAGYRPVSHHPSPVLALREPGRALVYLVAFLGAPLAPGSDAQALAAALVIGSAATALFAACAVYLLRRREDRALAYRMAPFLGIGAYAIGTGVLVAVTRLGFGVPQALAPRYVSFSLYLLVALLYLLPVAVGDATARGRKVVKPSRSVLTAGVVALVLLYALTAAQGVLRAGIWHAQVVYGKAALLFVNVLPTPAILRHVYPSLEDVVPLARALDRLGYLRPRLLASRAILPLAASAPGDGTFEALVRTADGRLLASGSARLPGGGGPAHAVLLTYREPASGGTVFAIAPTAGRPDGLVRALRQPAGGPARWQHGFDRRELPAATEVVEAWAFDAEAGRAFRLAGSHRLPLR